MKKLFTLAVAAMMATTMMFAKDCEWLRVGSTFTPEPSDFYAVDYAVAQAAVSTIMAEAEFDGPYSVCILIYGNDGADYLYLSKTKDAEQALKGSWSQIIQAISNLDTYIVYSVAPAPAQGWEWKQLTTAAIPTDFVNVSLSEALEKSMRTTGCCVVYHSYTNGDCDCCYGDAYSSQYWSTVIAAVGSYTIYYPAAKAEPAVPEAVDLGLSVNWANFNLGAAVPEEAGDYFAWGEINTKEIYIPANYTYDDDPVTLPSKADAAAHILGGDWRMPTATEFNELLANCDVEETNINGVDGVLVTSRKTGYTDKVIFFPFTGYMFDEATPQNKDQSGYYWTSSIDESYIDYAMFGWPYVEDEVSQGFRTMGLCIRPVQTKKSDPTAIVNNENENENEKVIENGQVVILRNGVRYNMLGQCVE